VSTIRRQLTRKLLVSFAVPLVAGGAIAYTLIREEMTEQIDAALNAQAEAVAAASAIAVRGDAVVLSPACSSFDMFRDYAHRAEVFRAAVRDLVGDEAMQ